MNTEGRVTISPGAVTFGDVTPTPNVAVADITVTSTKSCAQGEAHNFRNTTSSCAHHQDSNFTTTGTTLIETHTLWSGPNCSATGERFYVGALLDTSNQSLHIKTLSIRRG